MAWSASGAGDPSSGAGARRDRDWEAALARGGLPAPVAERLASARDSRSPWVATMTPAELLAARSHGLRPVAAVSGTCWYSYGYSWTEGHAAGWASALDRIRNEARAAGANAVVDVQMRTIRHSVGDSMDFTLLGTAVRVEGLQPSRDPVIATVPALEFVRLLEMGIVPTGLAVGARFEWLGQSPVFGSERNAASGPWGATAMSDVQVKLQSWTSQPIHTLGDFWNGIRRDAINDLRRHAATMGNGVLAHTQFGQLLRREQNQSTNYLGRHIVIGTVVDTPRNAPVPHGIEPVIDMRDAASPFGRVAGSRHTAYLDGESEGAI